MNINFEQIAFDEAGLIPAIIQDSDTGKVLTLAYMNLDALRKTLETKETWLYSRSRQQLWNKGETSGNRQMVKSVSYDCDGDAILVQVEPLGPACHTGEETCFHNQVYQGTPNQFAMINDLVDMIKQRRENPVDGSYTTYLFREGIDKVLKKVGEETSEVIIGAKNADNEELIWEISDLIYHTLILMDIRQVSLSDIKQELMKRHMQKEGIRSESILE
ncbi:bifunctional phosphoribosyl-AMP cyclohydrolase/phosphoribosyl-ATP diphosphatase HisIE [Lentibacillus sp. L22]|uniref:bifunctional phosphoribosyl-AMP cyclohydrolase/phosphoribosyl-ATP diphosphatase HisIE n=1 Tax=Lentibacillus TaxID=175304 RepID=UPI0022B1C09B|nr:bifunctional phosphoribosyl-AMP cyclohydrolase/phosphoribosyl-ATP diphosphatase HisIE [Lentibacillus daqui]